VVHWQPGAATEAARKCFSDWFETRGGAEAGEVQAVIAQVRLFIEQHGDSRFEHADERTERPVNNRAGWRRGEGEHREWLIPTQTWKSEVVLGHDPQFAARVLADRGMLATGTDGGLTRVMKIRGKSMRVYVVKVSILAGADNE
jgi:putative DNA primase/helicase